MEEEQDIEKDGHNQGGHSILRAKFVKCFGELVRVTEKRRIILEKENPKRAAERDDEEIR